MRMLTKEQFIHFLAVVSFFQSFGFSNALTMFMTLTITNSVLKPFTIKEANRRDKSRTEGGTQEAKGGSQAKYPKWRAQSSNTSS